MKLIRVIVIDPKNQIVEERQVPPTYEFAKEWIENIIQNVQIGPNVDLWIDEEGRINGTTHGFYLKHIEEPFMGKAFLCGDRGGEFSDLPPWLTLEEVKRSVRFYEGEAPPARFEVTTFDNVDDLLNAARGQPQN